MSPFIVEVTMPSACPFSVSHDRHIVFGSAALSHEQVAREAMLNLNQYVFADDTESYVTAGTAIGATFHVREMNDPSTVSMVLEGYDRMDDLEKMLGVGPDRPEMLWKQSVVVVL